jgi:hypothetical protein
MAQITHYPTTSYSILFPPNIKKLNHDIQEFLRHRFRSAYYAQFNKNPKKKTLHAKN